MWKDQAGMVGKVGDQLGRVEKGQMGKVEEVGLRMGKVEAVMSDLDVRLMSLTK